MGTLGQKLAVALVAAVAGSLAGLNGSAAEAKRPIVQTIAASQPAQMKLAVFHPSANPEPAPAPNDAPREEPSIKSSTAIIPRGDVAPLTRTAPVTRSPLAAGPAPSVESGLGGEPTVTKTRRSSDASASRQKPGERSRKRPSARFGQSEIVDPWSTKR